jgi:hypothetical protein
MACRPVDNVLHLNLPQFTTGSAVSFLGTTAKVEVRQSCRSHWLDSWIVQWMQNPAGGVDIIMPALNPATLPSTGQKIDVCLAISCCCSGVGSEPAERVVSALLHVWSSQRTSHNGMGANQT